MTELRESGAQSGDIWTALDNLDSCWAQQNIHADQHIHTLSMLSPLPWNLFSHYLAHSRTGRGSWGVGIVLWTALLHHWKTRHLQLRTSGVWWTVRLCAFLWSIIDLYSSSCGTPSYTINKNNITLILWYVYIMVTLKNGVLFDTGLLLLTKTIKNKIVTSNKINVNRKKNTYSCQYFWFSISLTIKKN